MSTFCLQTLKSPPCRHFQERGPHCALGRHQHFRPDGTVIYQLGVCTKSQFKLGPAEGVMGLAHVGGAWGTGR